MSSIKEFSGGMGRLFWYILSTPTLLASVSGIGFLILILALYPAAIYTYPFWKGDVEYLSVRPFEQQHKKLDMVVTMPDRLIPNRHDYVLQIETKSVDSSNAGFMKAIISINKDQPYLNFIQSRTLPIIIEQEISARQTVIERIQFEVLGGSQPRDPVTLIIKVLSDTSSIERAFSLPIDYVSIPMVALVTAAAPFLIFLIRLTIKAVFRI